MSENFSGRNSSPNEPSSWVKVIRGILSIGFIGLVIAFFALLIDSRQLNQQVADSNRQATIDAEQATTNSARATEARQVQSTVDASDMTRTAREATIAAALLTNEDPVPTASGVPSTLPPHPTATASTPLMEQAFDSTPTSTPISAQTGTPTLISTPTNPIASPTPTPRHLGEINLLESNQSLPTGWFTNGQYTYWEGFLNVQNELFIDITIVNCGDDEGNARLDIIQIYDPEDNLIEEQKNCRDEAQFRIRTFEKPGFYRIFLQDNDTGNTNGNGGTLIVEMLVDQTIYVNLR